MDDKLGKLSCLLSDFTDAGCSVLAHLDVNILQAVKDAGEDFGFDNDLSKINGVFGDLGEALADITLKLGVGVGDQSSKIWYCALVNHGLGELLGVLSDF